MRKLSKETLLRRIKEAVLSVDSGAEVWLYGSRARGTAREDSDWDILVLSEKEKLSVSEEGHILDKISDLIVETGEVIQLFAYGKEDWHNNHCITPFYKNIQQDAVML